MTHPEKRRSFGFKRWIVLALIVIEIILAGMFTPIRPPTELAAEALTAEAPILGGMAFTNTILTVLIADLLLLLLALSVSRSYSNPDRVPGGMAGFFEMMVEAIYNLVESVAGHKWARTFFPLVGTILFLVMTVNFMKLLPGMESVGWLHEVHEGDAYAAESIGGPLFILREVEEAAPSEGEPAADAHGEAASEAAPAGFVGVDPTHIEEGAHYNVVPWLRPASTDLNFTLSIALIAMITVQIIGLRAGGPGYLTKFFNFGPFLKMWVQDKLGAFDILMPFISIFIGVLELIAEFARIISFTFRLVGSMFAGAILLGVTGALFMVLQLPFLFLEIFFGAIQAFVFAMLTLVFLTMATQSHGGGHDDEHPAEQHA